MPTPHGIPVRLPNGTIIRSTHSALLDLPDLPIAARKAHIFPDLKNSALISIGQFCDNGFEARFTKQHVRIIDNHNTTILQGNRDPTSGLWSLNLHSPLAPITPAPKDPDHLSNNVHELTTKRDIVKYLHQACGSPVQSTWVKAIEAGYFTTWPGLTPALV
jgi:hypothetical protein